MEGVGGRCQVTPAATCCSAPPGGGTERVNSRHKHAKSHILHCDSLFIQNCKLFLWEFAEDFCFLSATRPSIPPFPPPRFLSSLDSFYVALHHKLPVRASLLSNPKSHLEMFTRQLMLDLTVFNKSGQITFLSARGRFSKCLSTFGSSSLF